MTKTSDPWHTEFGVQPFSVEKRHLKAQPVRPLGSEEAARRLGERLADTSAGVLVYSRRCAPDLGEYEELVVLATHGTVPPDVAELRRA